MNRVATVLLTVGLILGSTTQLASASVLNDLIDANRRRAGNETEFNDRRVRTSETQDVASALQELLDNNRRRGGSETHFEDRTVA